MFWSQKTLLLTLCLSITILFWRPRAPPQPYPPSANPPAVHPKEPFPSANTNKGFSWSDWVDVEPCERPNKRVDEPMSVDERRRLGQWYLGVAEAPKKLVILRDDEVRIRETMGVYKGKEGNERIGTGGKKEVKSEDVKVDREFRVKGVDKAIKEKGRDVRHESGVGDTTDYSQEELGGVDWGDGSGSLGRLRELGSFDSLGSQSSPNSANSPNSPNSPSLYDFSLNLNTLIGTLITTKDPLLNTILNQLPSNDFPKHFHEAVISGDARGHHYDWRFFRGLDYTQEEKNAIVRRTARAWLRFSRGIGLQTWLAHGSLLGWYWNGMTMPWDPDMDVQVSVRSLVDLARHYNYSLVVDTELPHHSYLVDVGPSFFHRSRSNGLNAIDARFIDTHTGMYVDITALAFTGNAESANKAHWASHEVAELNRVLVSDYRDQSSSPTVSPQALAKKAEDSRRRLVEKRELLHCRNRHFYRFRSLFPLRRTEFEGVEAWVPRRAERIIEVEYPKGLYGREYNGYRFDGERWVKNA